MGLFRKLSGKEVAEKVDNYNEVYGEILVGMDKEITSLENEVSKLKKRESRFRWLSISTLLISLTALIILVI